MGRGVFVSSLLGVFGVCVLLAFLVAFCFFWGGMYCILPLDLLYWFKVFVVSIESIFLFYGKP
jgi:hypothetical protein